MIDRAHLNDAIMNAIIMGIQRTCDDIFDLSQNTQACYVPRRTGFLAMSGDVIRYPNGGEIIYRAPYSAAVELGSEGTPIAASYRETVKRHWVKPYTRKNGTRVKGHWVDKHERVIEGGKTVTWEPRLWPSKELGEKITRVIKVEGKQPAQNYLGRATIERIPNIVKNIEFYLKQI